MKELQGRQKYVYIVISVLGWFFMWLASYTGNGGWMLLGMAPLMASVPFLVGILAFMEWVENDPSKKEPV